jgi:hypothetical protein
MNRREWLRQSLWSIAAIAGTKAATHKNVALSLNEISEPVRTALEAGPLLSPQEIYALLGFTTMTGEDPLKLWARLRPAETWLVGPLSPDGWAGQAFVADHEDIFAFRFLALPSQWKSNSTTTNFAEYCGHKFSEWLANWPAWWRLVGPKAPDNSYARLVWQMPDGGPEVTYEWAQTDAQEIVCRITNSTPADLVFQGYVPWDHNPPQFSVLYSESPDRHFLRGRSWIPGTRDGMRWVLGFSEPIESGVGVGTGLWHGVIPSTSKLYLCARQGQSYEPLESAATNWLAAGRIDSLLDRNREQYLAKRPEGVGWLADVPAAINDQLQWSEVYTPERKHKYITVSRAWSRENNSAPDFLWDSFFSALLVCQEDREKAFNLVRDITSWQNDQGMFAQYGQWVSHPDRLIFPVAWGHSQYPIGSLAVSKIYLRHPDKQFLADVYPKLLKAHRWWFADRGDGQPWRDGNRNGLLELGANYPQEIPYQDRQQTAYFESHDDSPQWWGGVAPYNEKTNTCELDTVERNCLYAMDAWILAWMARELAKEQEAAVLEREHAEMTSRINALLWDENKKCYFNRRWAPKDGSWFNPHMASDIFFSLLGKVAPPDRAQALKKLFYDPNKFAGEWIMPTISRDDPEYPKQHYWRGKAWAPINWLVYQAFKIHDWDDEANLLAASSAKMFLRPWRQRGECFENFLSTTGEGSSDPHYTWGALMVLIAIEELIDINPWHGLRFGNVKPVEEAAIRRYPIAGSLYDVSISEQHTEVSRDGKLLLSSDAPVEIRQVNIHNGTVTCDVRSRVPATLQTGARTCVHLHPGINPVHAEFH